MNITIYINIAHLVTPKDCVYMYIANTNTRQTPNIKNQRRMLLHSMADDLHLAGVEGQMNGKLHSSGEGETDGKDLPVCTYMCAAPPMIMGVVNGS